MAHKSQHIGPSSAALHHQYYTPQRPTRVQFGTNDQGDTSRMAQFQTQSSANWSTQAFQHDPYDQTHDYTEWEEHPWHISHFEALPDPDHQPHTTENWTTQEHGKDTVATKPTDNRHTQQHLYHNVMTDHQTPPITYHNYINHQRKAVARGPKITFPEFDGQDPEGWIQKAEKYFDMVGVPTEDRVPIAVMYIRGKAEFWWRGTGCQAHRVPWHHFCRMVEDRFYQISAYDVIGQFHKLKHTGSVSEYIDKFEELMALVRRNNPSLPEEYFTCSFVSGLKGHIQHHLQCHKPAHLNQAYWYAKRLEQANPFVKTFQPQFQANKFPKAATQDKDHQQTITPSLQEML